MSLPISIFEQVKSKVSLIEVISYYTEDELVACGDSTYQLSDHKCPLCGHADCFKVTDKGQEIFKCFSCDAFGDAIGFVSQLKEIGAGEAARLIAKDFNIKLHERKLTQKEMLFNIAADYYHNILIDCETKCIQKSGDYYTPLEYQNVYRKHRVTTLVDYRIGFSDNKLNLYLSSIGYSDEDILASGLAKKNDNGELKDYFERNLFIYPMFKNGICSAFTQKDPTGVIRYQMKKIDRLNDVLFYNEDAGKAKEVLYVVEGQNDVLSLIEAKCEGGVVGTCGQISTQQLEWLQTNGVNKKVITIFDSDDAGDKYRHKIHGILPKAIHIKLKDFKDIDDYLKAENDLIDAFQFIEVLKPTLKGAINNALAQIPDVESSNIEVLVPEETGVAQPIKPIDLALCVVERDGCYWKVVIDKEGAEKFVPLSDFIIKLKNIFEILGTRVREVQFVRYDGVKSRSVSVTSETKTSLKSFRSKVADACDGNFYGNELDLTHIWQYAYKHNTEKCVYIPDHTGFIETTDAGWLFRNCFIKPDGEVVKPDKSGVFWINGNTNGIRPKSISVSLDEDLFGKKLKDVPVINCNCSTEEVEEVTEIFVRMFAQNLGDIGAALLFLGWLQMNPYSNKIFEKFGFIPFMFMWGTHGIGKTTLLQWMLAIYGMDDNTYTTLPNLRSGVGFERKLGYYSSLPACIDEIRNGPELNAFAGRFRSWYNKVGRSLARVNDSYGTHDVPIRANFMFSGQDIFMDDALRSRTLVVRVTKENRETVKSYSAINKLHMDKKLTAIGFNWIMESVHADYEILFDEMDKLNRRFLEVGCNQRTSHLWSMIGVFSQELGRKYFPDFDFIKYMREEGVKDNENQIENNFLTKFFDVLEGIMYNEQFCPFSGEHFKLSNGEIAIWFPEVFRILSTYKRDQTEETFTKDAIKSAIQEEPYFKEETVKKMGINQSSRRAICLNYQDESAPQSLKNIAEFIQKDGLNTGGGRK